MNALTSESEMSRPCDWDTHGASFLQKRESGFADKESGFPTLLNLRRGDVLSRE